MNTTTYTNPFSVTRAMLAAEAAVCELASFFAALCAPSDNGAADIRNARFAHNMARIAYTAEVV